MKPSPSDRIRDLQVKCRRIGQLETFEVLDDELDQMARGQSGGIYLNFGLVFFSCALSLLAALCSGTFANPQVFQILVIVTVVALIAALVLLTLWWRTRGRVSKLITRIRSRT